MNWNFIVIHVIRTFITVRNMPKRKSAVAGTSSVGKKRKYAAADKTKRIADLQAAGFNEHGGALTDKLIDELIAGRKNIKVFFPMCADSVDMKRVYDKGHDVVGIEIAKTMIEKFYKKQGLEFITKKIKNGSVYKTKDNRLRIYCCDFFKFDFSLEGNQFDAVVDQRAICYLYKSDQPRYCQIMKSLLVPEFTYFFDTNDVDKEKLPESRGRFVVKDVESWFGEGYHIDLIQKLDATLTHGKNMLSLVMKLYKK